MRAQHAQPAHVSVRTVVAQRAVHAAFNVVDRAGLHQVDHRLVTRERRAGKPHQVLRADPRRGLKRSERDAIAVAQMMMRADGHAIAQPAKPQSGFEVRDTLVPVCGIVGVAANWGPGFAPCETIRIDALIRHGLASVDQGRHAASDCVAGRVSFDCCSHINDPDISCRWRTKLVERFCRDATLRPRSGGGVLVVPTSHLFLLCHPERSAAKPRDRYIGLVVKVLRLRRTRCRGCASAQDDRWLIKVKSSACCNSLDSHPHLLGPRNQLQRALYHRSIDHLGSQADDAQSTRLRLFVSGNNLRRFLQL